MSSASCIPAATFAICPRTGLARAGTMAALGASGIQSPKWAAKSCALGLGCVVSAR